MTDQERIQKLEQQVKDLQEAISSNKADFDKFAREVNTVFNSAKLPPSK